MSYYSSAIPSVPRISTMTAQADKSSPVPGAVASPNAKQSKPTCFLQAAWLPKPNGGGLMRYWFTKRQCAGKR